MRDVAMDVSRSSTAMEKGQRPNGSAPNEPPLLAAGQPDSDSDQEFRSDLLQYQELFDFAPVGYLVTDPNGVIQKVNHTAAALLGTRRQFLEGTPLLFFVAANERRSFAANLFQASLAAKNYHQWLLKFQSRHTETVSVIATVVASPAPGKPKTLRWTLQDITRQRQIEERLRAEQDFTTSLIELAEAVIVEIDQGGHIVRTNNFLCTLMGNESGDLTGSLLIDVLVPEDRDDFQDALTTLCARDPNAHGVFRLRGVDGQLRTIAWSERLLMPALGQDPKILIVGNDITDLQEAQRRAVQAERLAAIGEVSAALAHESRNALQRSIASLGLLAFRVQDQPELMELVERVQKAQDDLHQVYESVRAYAAPIKLEMELCDLPSLWRMVWENLSLARKGHEAELREEIKTCDLDCEASPVHLRQVFRNLLENALDATDRPLGITIRCTDGELDGQPAVQIEVRDDGPGFNAEDRARAFKLFFTTKARGTGLGLSICKRLVEAHGGRIALAQPDGPATAVVITLPRRRA
jgi:PAS domain S-box-containing protein